MNPLALMDFSKRLHVLPWILLLSMLACGKEEVPDVTSGRGVNSFFNGVTDTGLTKESADAMEDELILGLDPYGYDIAQADRAVDGSHVTWRDGVWHCIPDDNETWCAGEQQVQMITVTTSTDSCPWRSAYRHELLHRIQQIAGIFDYKHERPEWVVTFARDCTN